MSPKNVQDESSKPQDRTKSWEKESHSLFNGAAIVFTTKTSVKPWWQVRIKLPGTTGYALRKSLKTTDLSEAIKLASDMYLDMRARHSQGIPLETYSWDELADAYISTRNGQHYQKYFSFLQSRYFSPFFSKFSNVEVINDDTIREYWNWRIGYWTEHSKTSRSTPTARRATNVSESPSYATIRKEMSALRSVLRWAADRQIIPLYPTIEHPYLGDHSKDARHRLNRRRRATFTKEEYSHKLLPAINGLCNRTAPLAPYKKRAHEALRLAILMIANTLLRPQEMYWLRYEQVQLVPEGDEIYTVIYLSEQQAKTKRRRTIICPNGNAMYEYVQRFRRFAKWSEPTDLIFASERTRTKPRDLTYQVRTRFKEWDLLEDMEGNRRSLYSLRHFAIERLLIENVPPAAIAKLAGTSLAMISRFYDDTDAWMYREQLHGHRKNFPRSVPDEMADAPMLPAKGTRS